MHVSAGIIGFLLLALGTWISSGFWSLVALTTVMSSLAVLTAATVRCAQSLGARHIVAMMSGAIAVCCVLFAGKSTGYTYWSPESDIFVRMLTMSGGIFVIASFFARRPLSTAPFFLILALGVASRIYIVVAAPAPVIDVWSIIQNGSAGLLRGENPFTMTWDIVNAAGPLKCGFIYPPLTLYVTAPFYLVFGDVRYAFVAADIATVLLLRATVSKFARKEVVEFGVTARELGTMVGLLWLFFPRSSLVLENSWSEPLMVAFGAGTLWALANRRLTTAAVVMGLFVASKQHALYFMPFFIWTIRDKRFWIIAGGVALATALPFMAWDIEAFVEGLVLHHARNPVRPDALTVSAWLVSLGSSPLPSWVPFALLGGLMALFVRRRRSIARMFAFAALGFLVVNVSSKYAFCNYYYLNAAAVIFGIAAALIDLKRSEATLLGSGHPKVGSES